MTHKQCPHCSEALVCPGHGAVQRPLVAPCPTKRGGLWVSVHDTTGVEAPGVPVVVAGTTTTTDEAGIAAFDPLDDGTYAVQLGKLPPTVAERFAPPAVPSIDGISVTQGKIMHAELVLRRRPTLEVRVSPPVDATVTITHGDGSKRSAKTKGGVADFGTVEVGVYNVQVQRGGDGPGDGRGNGDGERAEVGYGDHRQVAVELPQTVNPVIDVENDRDALAVGAAATTVTLHADGAFQGRGQLRVTAGVNHIRVLQGGQPLVLQNGRRDFRNIDQTGVQVQLEATSASALQGVTLEWELFSDNVECGDPATEGLTAVAATLVIHDRAGHAIDRATARGNGRILAKGPSAQRRAKVTVRCQPARYTGQLKLVDRNGNNLALYAAAAGGNALPLPHQLPSPVPAQGVNLYVEGIQPSAAAAGDALDLAIEGVANRADHVVLTVVEATLEVCGPRPNDGEPPPLAEADKRDPGRELIGQAWTHRSPRARVRVRKNPTDAPCTLRLRPPAGNEVSLFEAEDHVEGEVAAGLPYSITAAAFDTAHGETGDGLVLWAEGREEAATPTQLSLDVQDIADDCDAIGFTVRMATVEVGVKRRDAAALTGEVRVNLYPSHGDNVLLSAPVDGEGKVQLQVPPAPYRVGIAPADGLEEAGFRILRKPPAEAGAGTGAAPPPLTAAVQVELDTPTSLSYELAPPYERIQFVGFQIETGTYIGKDDPGPTGDADAAVTTDIQARCSLMKSAITHAYGQGTIDPSPTTLKIFMAPEFYFRGRRGAYPLEALSQIPEQMRQETTKAQYDDWMFVLGTAIGSMERSEAQTLDATNVTDSENYSIFQYVCDPDDRIADVAVGWTVHLAAKGTLYNRDKGAGEVFEVETEDRADGKRLVTLRCKNVPKFPTKRKHFFGYFGKPTLPGFSLSLQAPGETGKHTVRHPEVALSFGTAKFDCTTPPPDPAKGWKGWVIQQGKFRGYVYDSADMGGGRYQVQFDRLTKQAPENGTNITLLNPRQAEIFNTAFVEKGGTYTSMTPDGHGIRNVTIYKENISLIDFEGLDFDKDEFNEEHRHLATLDNDPMTRLLPTHGSTDTLGMDATDANDNEATDHGLGGGSVFTMNDIRFGVEVCLDHAEQRLFGYHNVKALPTERRVQVQLIPSCGMEIKPGACVPDSVVFNVDSWGIDAATNAGTTKIEPEAWSAPPVPTGMRLNKHFKGNGFVVVYPAQDKPAPVTVG